MIKLCILIQFFTFVCYYYEYVLLIADKEIDLSDDDDDDDFDDEYYDSEDSFVSFSMYY